MFLCLLKHQFEVSPSPLGNSDIVDSAQEPEQKVEEQVSHYCLFV